MPSREEIERLGFVLPPATDAVRRLVVALDLHDTLVRVRPSNADSASHQRGAPSGALNPLGWSVANEPHGSVANPQECAWEARHVMTGPDGGEWEALVRPGLSELLGFVGERCEGVLWTVGGPRYVKPFMHAVDPDGSLRRIVMSTSMRYTRQGEEEGKSGWAMLPACKPLELLNRNPDTVVQVDDREEYLRMAPSNAIVLPPYFGEAPDSILVTLRQALAILTDVVEAGGSVVDGLRSLPPSLATQRPEGGVSLS